jgi:hypothetical protein
MQIENDYDKEVNNGYIGMSAKARLRNGNPRLPSSDPGVALTAATAFAFPRLVSRSRATSSPGQGLKRSCSG